MRLFCTGDLHIGRRSSSSPDDSKEHYCAEAWLRAVDSAIEEKADVVLLSGDVINKDNQFFEAAGPLEAGLKKLAEQNIHVCTVAGNHDFYALPQFLKGQSGEYIHLLGEGGRWEDVTIERNGEKLRVFGWSFPTEWHAQNPLSDLQVDRSGIPTVGLLHCDIDSSDTRYVPVPLRDLKNRNEICFWLTGHIHAPRCYNDAGTPVLNPGSLQAMDLGETGDHGPWMVDINGGLVSEPRQLKTSTVKYCRFDIDVTGWEAAKLKTKIISEILNRSSEAKKDTGAKIVSARVNITGTTDAQNEINDIRSQLKNSHLSDVHIDKLNISVAPTIDLHSLAQGKGAKAVAARLLLSIEGGTFAQDHPKLLKDAEKQMISAYKSTAYELVKKDITDSPDDDLPNPADAIAVIKAQCLQLLNKMMEADS
ncbi:MAG: metallophosphoesterase family protein [Armatimonadota bacterium]|jgi:exonuclease SbcD